LLKLAERLVAITSAILFYRYSSYWYEILVSQVPGGA
jgi:hypothetical protein